MTYKPLPVDISNIPIQGGLSGVPYIQNITTYSGVWSPIVMGFEESKQIILQPRGAVEWYYATASGSDYFTLRSGAALHAPVVTVSGTTIGWVMCNQDTTFEILVGR